MADLNCYDFGRLLLETNDLDPVYVALWGAQLEPTLLRRWLLAYWCFYHVGTASWISDVREKDDGAYWERMRQAAGSKEWPRSSERRHFRGRQAAASVAYLQSVEVDQLFSRLSLGTSAPAHLVMERVREWQGFGPWISFKVADMLERLGMVQVIFDETATFYASPMAAAHTLHEVEGAPTIQESVASWAAQQILDQLGKHLAPPRYERPINLQEVETILCKWGSYRKGHYDLGEDVKAVHQGLFRSAKCRISQRLIQGAKKGGLW